MNSIALNNSEALTEPEDRIQALTPEQVLQQLHTMPQGLSEAEAGRRLAQYGPNQIQVVHRHKLGHKFISQFTHLFALMLWVAALLCFIAQAVNPASEMLPIGIAILCVLVINGMFSFLQEYKAEQTLTQLRRMLPEKALVMRAGQLQEQAAAELVPGDLVHLREGDKVPADLRLIETQELMLNISSLTGESVPASLGCEASASDSLLRAGNIAFSSTFVVKGNGIGVVYATGMQSEYGRIAGLTQRVEPGIGHIQGEIRHASQVISIISVGLGLLFFILGQFRGIDIWHALVFALGIIVANVPEGLPPTMTLAMAMGTQRMARRQFLVRDLNVLENLGAITVIATDKTGTVTQNRMTVTGLY
ncbi:MAG: HAD-IC family P-type ATPase, partial [Candidatus Sericytochromatia bacterium]